jgi:hypothetical protein
MGHFKLCIYCGASSGNHPKYSKKTKEFAKYLGEKKIDLVYGGGNVGLMGAIANGVLEAGQKVYGVIPEKIKDLEEGHMGITDLIEVGSMHERKQKMFDLSDGFLALPGGFGTLDEICEMITWLQLGYHSKPVGFWNLLGYYDYLKDHFDKSVKEGFVKESFFQKIHFSEDSKEVLSSLLSDCQ